MSVFDDLLHPNNRPKSDDLSNLSKEIESLVPDIQAWRKEFQEFINDLKKGGSPKSGNVYSAFNLNTQQQLKELSDSQRDYQDAVTKLNTTLNNGVTNLSRNIVALTAMFTGGLFFKNIFQGAIRDEAEFLVGIREIAYTTQGISGSTVHLQESWQDVGKTVRITGKNVTVFQKQYLSNLRKGVKSQEDALTVTKSGLHVSHMLGSSAEGTADLFFDWHMQLGRSNSELSQVARGMQNTARWTGVTGDALVEVAKSSKEFMKNMRGAGNLTADAMTNIIGINAEAQKLGASEVTNQMTKGLSSMHSFLTETNGGMKSLLVQGAQFGGMLSDEFSGAELQSQIMQGTLLQNADATQAVAKGMEEYIIQMARGQGIEIDNLNEETIQNMDPKIRASLDMVTKGMGVGPIVEVAHAIKSVKDGVMSYSEKIADLDARMKAGTMTTEQYMSAEEQLNKLRVGQQLDKISAVIKDHKVDGNFADTIAKHGGAANVETMLKNAVAGVNKSVKDSGASSDLLIDPNKISEALRDDKAYYLLQKSLDEAQQAADTATKKNLDPISQVQYATNEVNETIRDYSGGALDWFFRIFGALGIIGSQVTIIAGLMAAQATVNAMSGRGLAAIPGLLSKVRGGGAATTGSLGAFKAATSGASAAGGGGGMLGGLGGGLMKSLPGVMSKVGAIAKAAGPIALVVGTIGSGLVQSFSAAANAGNVFNKNLEDLSITQKLAAHNAGYLTGTFNFLTFGIFSKYLGPTGIITGWLTKFLAKLGPFKYMIPIFGQTLFVIDAVVIALKTLWNSLKVVYAFLEGVFLGIWEEIMEALKPLQEAFQKIWEPLAKAWDEFSADLGFTGINIGEISDYAREAGKMVGWLLSYALWPLFYGIKALTEVLKFIISPFEYLENLFTKIFDTIGNAIDWIAAKIDLLPSWLVGSSVKEAASSASSAAAGAAASGALAQEEKDYYTEATKKGSIYVHDIYVESMLASVLDGLNRRGVNVSAAPLMDPGEVVARKYMTSGENTGGDESIYEKVSACERHLQIIAGAYKNTAGNSPSMNGLATSQTKSRPPGARINSNWNGINPNAGATHGIPNLEKS